ncbi:helix-turn-helix domain-containing protein [Thalassotalea psychrophila]|uniref:Helix-turn-helix domain-containing protein n=1 Tax=Thalassotalea psychrophila TaxID=3065647 RepID=A0ABY9TZH2_9GAMM|nr:helix-turn-helix domain-containing protein [Colwelliaceae bacterium SQ149]
MKQDLSGVCIVATDGVFGLGIMQAKEMFYSASLRLALMQQKSAAKAEVSPLIEAFPVVIASPEGEAIKTYSGTAIQCDVALVENAQWDFIVLSHFWGDAEEQLEKNSKLITWLQAQNRHKTPIMAFGSGVFWLAQAGLLDGREATTYWHYLDDFKQRFPLVNWQAKASITQSDNLCCVAGVSSSADMLLHNIAKLCGVKVAQGISRDMLYDTRRTYDVPPLGLESQRQHSDQQILQIQNWLDLNYSEEFDFAQLVQQFGMSKRNFARRFQKATGNNPLQYLQELRLTMAKEMLIYSDNSIKHIALDVGYQDSSYFSAIFKRQMNMSPLIFRQQYRNKI